MTPGIETMVRVVWGSGVVVVGGRGTGFELASFSAREPRLDSVLMVEE